MATKLHLFLARVRKAARQPAPVRPAPRVRRRRRVVPQIGFTLVELAILVLLVAVLAQLAMTAFQSYTERVNVGNAARDIASLGVEITQYANDRQRLPDSLADIGRAGMKDPWGNAYQYLNHANRKGNGRMRKDKNIVPINSDFDLYSMGKDGATQDTLTAPVSRDDIVRANNGRFVGLAADYDP